MQKNYVSPDYRKDSFTCPHCGTLSLMHYICVSYVNGYYHSTNASKMGGDGSILIATCCNCKQKIIWIEEI